MDKDFAYNELIIKERADLEPSSNLFLTNYIKPNKLDATDLSYIQGKLTVLYPNDAWLTNGSVNNLQSIELFKLLLEENFTKEELRSSFSKFSKTKTYSNFFKIQDFMELAISCKHKLYTVTEYDRKKVSDGSFASTNNTRYYLGANDYLLSPPFEVYGVPNLPIPRAIEYNTYYKIYIHDAPHKVIGREGLKFEIISKFPNYLGCYRAPERYYE